MTKDFKFYKDPDNKWYIDLPEWKGSKAELQMVCGADTMLDIISEGENTVAIHFDLNSYEGSDVLELKEIHPADFSGATYFLKSFRGIELNLEMWLCDVTKFVFGDFPKNIYFNARISVF